MLLALALAATPVAFDPLAFFAGRTEGVGRLRIALHRHRDVLVHGKGEVGPDGALVLDQRVIQAGRPATARQWRLHTVGPGRYAGMLSDAVGPVAVTSEGRHLHIAYRAKGHIAIEQWLTLAPDGRSAANRLTARRFGIAVARLTEAIRKVD